MLSLLAAHQGIAQETYYGQYVQLKGYYLQGSDEPLWLILINKFEDQIKTKYFAYNSQFGSVPERFNQWKQDKKIILYASGSYITNFTSSGTPVGLTIDNGVVVNRNIEPNGYDGLVIVYPSGKIDVLNLKYTLKLNLQSREYDIQHNELDKNDFINWATATKFTVFQTHLLVYNNQLSFSSYSSSKSISTNRRFLACGTNLSGQMIQVIVNDLHEGTLYNRAQIALNILRYQEGLNVAWMINLDTGSKDIFQAYNEKGEELTHFRGTTPFKEAVNLIAYYYE